MEIDPDKVAQIERIKSIEQKMLAAAVMYAEAGFYIIPVRPSGKSIPGKRHTINNYGHASNRVNTVSRWYGVGGEFEGWNIGLVCGSENGSFAIDIDRKDGGVDGFATAEELFPDDWTFNGPIQATPSGGQHLLFNWVPHARASTGGLGPGIDTRGGDGTPRGHIVVWPSTVKEGAYQWIQYGPTTDVPNWVIDKLGRENSLTFRGTREGRGNEEVGAGDVEQKLPLEVIREALDHIPLGQYEYDDWYRIGMAVHTQYPGHNGFKVWDDWSKTDDHPTKGNRYEAFGTRTRWYNSFKDEGPVRIGTLLWYAKKHGFDPSKYTENEDQIDKLVAKINETFAVVPIGGKVFIAEKQDVPPELMRIQSQYRFWTRDGFRHFMENRLEFAANARGQVVKRSHADIWLGHEKRREYPHGPGMFPNQPTDYNGYLNLWQGFSTSPAPGDWGLFRDHIRNIMCSGDEDLFNWTLDWMADLFQDPANPKGTCVVMHGIEGCGKGTFAQILGHAFGTHFKHLTDEEHLIGRFNGHLTDALLIFADEVTYGGNKKVAGKLKSLVTERYITAERKGVDAIQYYNCARLLIASNESWFVPAGPQSRRWAVFEFEPNRANDREYFNALNKQMKEEGGIEAMMHDLMEREITYNLQRAPATEALQRQRNLYATTDSLNAWWFNCLTRGTIDAVPLINDGETKSWPEEVGKADLYDAYEAWCSQRHQHRYVKPRNEFGKIMTGFGLASRKATIAKQRVPIYKIPPIEQAREKATQHGYVNDEH